MRSSPTPAAPAASPRRVSTAEATLHSTTIWCPSSVRGGSASSSSSAACGRDGPPPRSRTPVTPAPPALAPSTTSTAADHELAGVGVEEGRLAGGEVEHLGTGAGDHRDPESAGDDRRVRARAARDRDRADQARLGQFDQVGRAHLAPDQDEVARLARRRQRRCESALRAQPLEDRAGDLPDVARPLGQLGVVQLLHRRGVPLGGLPHRGGGIGAVAHRRDRGRGERRIARYQRPDRDDLRFRTAPGLPQPFGQRGPLGRHRGERGGDVLGRGAGGRGVVDGGVADDSQYARCRPRRHRQTAESDRRLGRRAGLLSHPPIPARPPHPAGREATSRSACRISADEAAPGSSCPTLRGPR